MYLKYMYYMQSIHSLKYIFSAQQNMCALHLSHGNTYLGFQPLVKQTCYNVFEIHVFYAKYTANTFTYMYLSPCNCTKVELLQIYFLGTYLAFNDFIQITYYPYQQLKG